MASRLTPEQLVPRSLGERRVPSPLNLSTHVGDGLAHYVPDRTRVLYKVAGEHEADFDSHLFLERAGPREWLYFDPQETRVGVVTCGGLSPGVNNVIRSMVLEMTFQYGVRDILGFRFGFRGMNPARGYEPVPLTYELIRTIHNEGGSVLGTSRGAEDVAVMADYVQSLGIDILFCIGGDGTLRGAHALFEELEKRSARVAVVGIPKTIDNDIPFVYKTFGFDTAVEVVRQAIDGAHVEAIGTVNGVGLVKVMGRDSGFIAAYTALAENNIDFCLVPEVPFTLEALLAALERRLARRGHAVIVVAEGAGQNLASPSGDRDRSGNVRYGDIGSWLRDAIKQHFKTIGTEVNVKYIDPSYAIRSVPANAHDSAFCLVLAHSAVHAGMAGRTGMVVGFWNHRITHVPIPLAVLERKKIDPAGSLWSSVLTSTGQPHDLTGVGATAVAAGRGPV